MDVQIACDEAVTKFALEIIDEVNQTELDYEAKELVKDVIITKVQKETHKC